MKVINATWDQVNTGLKTCEIVFEKNDTFQTYLDAYIEGDYQFSVVKVPVGDLELVHQLEDLEYRFMETQFSIMVNTDEFDKFDKRWMRVITRTSYTKIEDKDEFNILLQNIGEDMFRTDRISLDENLGKKISKLRYVNWLTDLFEKKEAEIFFLNRDNERAGFFVLRRIEKDFLQSVIAGVFNKYQRKALSVALIYYYLKYARDYGAKSILTSFSSNNSLMMNTFTKTIAFKINKIYYVLRKMIKE